MPLVGEFHSKFWHRQDADHRPPALGPSNGGYPAWQAHIILGSLFGPIGAWWDVQWARLKWWIAFVPRVHRLTNEQRVIYLHTLTVMEGPIFAAAQPQVRGVARTIGFREKSAWLTLKRAMGADVDQQENVYRHLEACTRTTQTLGHPVPNPDLNLAVELAYTGYSLLRK